MREIIPIPEDYANAIWDALMKYAGATEYWRENFLAHRADITEYRFQGGLGFGGKAWHRQTKAWDVTCYPEDETPERLKMIEQTNKRLAELWASYQKGEPPCME